MTQFCIPSGYEMYMPSRFDERKAIFSEGKTLITVHRLVESFMPEMLYCNIKKENHG